MKVIAFLLCCIFLPVVTQAQQRYVVSHLDNTSGLSNNGITGVFQDYDKLLWVNTWDGLTVYNGITFNSFKSNKNEPSSSLPNNVITKVREDQSHRIWICTEEGITKYNKLNGLMSHYFYDKGTNKEKGKSADYMLAISNKNNIVCGLRLDTILYSYDTLKNAMVPIKFSERAIGKIAKIEFDDLNRLWTLSLGGDFRVFEKRGSIYHLLAKFHRRINTFNLVNHRIIFAEDDVKLWEVTKDLQLKELQSINHFVADIGYYQGHYFIAWQYKGLQEYGHNFEPVDDVLRYCPALKNIQVTSLTETDGKTLWVATSDRGIFKIKRQSAIFGLGNQSHDELLSNSNVQAIQTVGDELWLGTRNSGIFKITGTNANKTNITQINPINSWFDRTFNSYYSFAKGRDGNYYIGSDAMGAGIYDPLQKKFFRWEDVRKTQKDPDFFRVHSFLPQKDSSLYVGYNGGVYHIKVARQNGGSYQLVYANPIRVEGHFLKPGNNLVYALADIGDWILIGYRFAGLSLLHKQDGKTINIAAQAYDGGLTNNNVLSLLVDSRHRVWIGTSDGIYWAPAVDMLSKSPRFHHINTKNGLPNNIVHAIEEDKAGNIWLSTNQGLAKIDVNSFKVIQYGVEDGLQNAEFSDHASFRDGDGKLYFGGVAGYNSFNPDSVSVDKTLSNLLITDFTVAGKTSDDIQLMVIKPTGNGLVKEFHLLRNENHFNLKVQPADGYTNIKFQYQIFLKGYDTKWRELSESNRIEYNSLPPGSYDFFIKWTNGQGNWSSERNIFRVQIHQYIWLTAAAKVIYVLLIIGAIYIYFLVRKGREEIKRRLAVENLIRVKEKKLFQEKMDFFTNITHELQTPLTLILGSIERFFFKNDNKEVKHKGWNFLQVANQEAFRMQYLIHQLLEFRKAEAGHLGLQPTSFNVSNLIRSITGLFEPIGEQNSLHLSVAIAGDIQVSNDKDKIEKIVFNLLSNAFKYTKPEGFINVRVSEDGGAKTMQIVVANSGYDGPVNDLNLLFEQFYTVDHANQSKISSGIGLAFTKQLVELLGGSISVTAEDQWITFTVTLPLVVEATAVSFPTEAKSSEKPSYLVKSAIGAHLVPENRIEVNNDLALVENLSNQSRKTILIVEDEPAIRNLLREILKDNYIIYEAENGKMALAILKKIVPNLIVSDVLMDGIDGLKLCTSVKNTMETCHIPFLLLSALASAEQRIDGFEAGADGYLTKPFNAPALLRKIEQLIQYREKIQSTFNRDDYAQPLPDAGLRADDRAFLEKVMKVVIDNMANPDMDATYLEKAMCMSRMSFYRKIKGFTNMTPVELIKHARLKHAAQLLRATTLTVSEIYYQTGFNNQSYFYREFKRVYNYSPKEFREQNHYSEAEH